MHFWIIQSYGWSNNILDFNITWCNAMIIFALTTWKQSDPRNTTNKTLIIAFVINTSYSDHLLPRRRHGKHIVLLVTMYYCRMSKFCSLRFSIQGQWFLKNKWLGIFYSIGSGTIKIILIVTPTVTATRNTNEMICFYIKNKRHKAFSIFRNCLK